MLAADGVFDVGHGSTVPTRSRYALTETRPRISVRHEALDHRIRPLFSTGWTLWKKVRRIEDLIGTWEDEDMGLFETCGGRIRHTCSTCSSLSLVVL